MTTPSRTFWRVLRNAGAVKAPAYLCQSFVAACLAVAEEAVSRGNVVLFCGGGNYATTRGLPGGAKRIRTLGFSGMRWWMSGNFSVSLKARVRFGNPGLTCSPEQTTGPKFNTIFAACRRRHAVRGPPANPVPRGIDGARKPYRRQSLSHRRKRCRSRDDAPAIRSHALFLLTSHATEGAISCSSSLARFADPFDEESPSAPELRDLIFERRAIALGPGFLQLGG